MVYYWWARTTHYVLQSFLKTNQPMLNKFNTLKPLPRRQSFNTENWPRNQMRNNNAKNCETTSSKTGKWQLIQNSWSFLSSWNFYCQKFLKFVKFLLPETCIRFVKCFKWSKMWPKIKKFGTVTDITKAEHHRRFTCFYFTKTTIQKWDNVMKHINNVQSEILSLKGFDDSTSAKKWSRRNLLTRHTKSKTNF